MHSSEILHAILDSTTDAIFLIGQDRELKLSNPAYDNLLTYAGVRDEGDQKPGTSFFTDDVIRRATSHYEDAEQVSDRMIEGLHIFGCR